MVLSITPLRLFLDVRRSIGHYVVPASVRQLKVAQLVVRVCALLGGWCPAIGMLPDVTIVHCNQQQPKHEQRSQSCDACMQESMDQCRTQLKH